MEVWKIVFHSILKMFHFIPFWHLPYSIPKFPFHSIPCPAKDSPSEDRPSRGQGQECSRPRTKDTAASVLYKKKEKRFSKKFLGDLQKKQKKVFANFSLSQKKNKKRFLTFSNKLLTIQKTVLFPAADRAIFEDLRLRGQELDCRGQGQELQNVSSRPRASPRTPFLLLGTTDARVACSFVFTRPFSNS